MSQSTCRLFLNGGLLKFLLLALWLGAHATTAPSNASGLILGRSENRGTFTSKHSAFPITPIVSIPDTGAAPGEIVRIPIVVDDAADIAGAEIKVTYNPDILTALDAQTTVLTSDFALADTVLPGKIAISLARATGIMGGSGVFVTITFRVAANAMPDSTTTLAFAKLALFDENTDSIHVTTKNGIFTVKPSNVNNAPEEAYKISNTTLVVGCGDFVRNLKMPFPVFVDDDGDALTYSAQSSNESVAIARMQDSLLIVTPVSAGKAVITVTANDNKGGLISTQFEVTVLQEACISVSPNPFTPNDDTFNDRARFQFSNEITASTEVLIFNMAGRRVKSLAAASGKSIEWDGRDDDGHELRPGVYLYIIKGNGKTIKNGTVTLMR